MPEKTKFVIAGGATFSDSSKTEYVRLIEKMSEGRREQVVFLGHVPHRDMPELYKASDIFVLPSQVEEALGMSLIEAMSTGLAVLGSDRGGIPELIEDGVNGFVVKDYEQFQAWSKKINELLDNEPLCLEFGKRAREKIQAKFSWQRIGADISDVYANLLSWQIKK